jgi:phage terminase small subunit
MTPRRQKFIDEYLRDFNAAAAARRAGYSASMSREAHRVLRSPEIAAALKARMEEEERTLELSAGRVLDELVRIAFSDIRRYVRIVEGRLALVPDDELGPGESAAVARVAPGSKRRGPRIRMHDKRRALRALVRHLGLYERRAFVDPQELNERAGRIFARLLREAGVEDEVPALPAPPAGEKG